jgi:hypothetical protein
MEPARAIVLSYVSSDCRRNIGSHRRKSGFAKNEPLADMSSANGLLSSLDTTVKGFHRIAFGAHRGSEFDVDVVAVDHAVEEFPQRGQVKLFGREGNVHLLEILCDGAWRDVDQRNVLGLGTVERITDGVNVILMGVGVGDLTLKELLPGEAGAWSGVGDDGGARPAFDAQTIAESARQQHPKLLI